MTIFICVFECFSKSGGVLGVWSTEQCCCVSLGHTTRFSSLIKYIFISCYHHPDCRSRTPIIPAKQNKSPVESYHQAPAHCSPFSDNLNVPHISSASQHLSITITITCFVLPHSSKLGSCPEITFVNASSQ